MKAITIVISLIFSMLSCTILAQDSLPYEKTIPDINTRSYIKFSPLHLLEIEPSLQLGYEYPYKSLRIQHEIGYVGLFNPAYELFQWDVDFNKITSNGFKLRTTIKFPLKTNDDMHRTKYIGIDFMYKYLVWTETDVQVFRMNSYWQMMDFTTTKHVVAVHFTYGINRFVSEMNNIITDSYFGVGIRYKKLSNNIPSDVSEDSYSWYDFSDGMMISVMTGFKFGFGI